MLKWIKNTSGHTGQNGRKPLKLNLEWPKEGQGFQDLELANSWFNKK